MKLRAIAALALLWSVAGAAAAVGNIADVTVHDRAENRTLPVHHHQGRDYVVGKPGNEYEVRVRNRTGADILAVVSVDGVNVITGETASPQQGGYVLSPWRTLDIAGWRKSLASTAAFYFTPLPDSYAARTGRPDHVGVIGAALFRRKQPPVEIGRIAPRAPAPLARSDARDPAGASAAESASGAAQDAARESVPSAKLGTGHGRNEVSHARQVDFERATSDPAETVMIYYDSRSNLVTRGVIKEPPRAPLPHPFPGFVPDPA